MPCGGVSWDPQGMIQNKTVPKVSQVNSPETVSYSVGTEQLGLPEEKARTAREGLWVPSSVTIPALKLNPVLEMTGPLLIQPSCSPAIFSRTTE